MALVFEDDEVVTAGPGLHAFIVGVSRYRHLPNGGGTPATNSFGLKQLTSTALSAYRLYEWLLANRTLLPRKLATVHLLLSPSPAELTIAPEMATLGADAATRRAFAAEAKRWRTRARKSNDEFTLFYFAGHGLAREKGDSILLCEDFGDPDEGPFHNAVDHDHLFNGMAPPPRVTEAIARRQVYFVDACRTVSTARDVERPTVPDLWDIALGGIDNREAPIFFGAIPGTEAMALDGVQSLFSQALIACLDHDALRPLDNELDANGDPRYGASVDPLNLMLKRRLEILNDKYSTTQRHNLTGHVSNLVLRYVDERPEVDVQIEIDPAADAAQVTYDVQDAHGGAVFGLPGVAPNPFTHRLPAGMYRFSASVANPQPPYVPFATFGQVLPPGHPVRAKVRR